MDLPYKCRTHWTFSISLHFCVVRLFLCLESTVMFLLFLLLLRRSIFVFTTLKRIISVHGLAISSHSILIRPLSLVRLVLAVVLSCDLLLNVVELVRSFDTDFVKSGRSIDAERAADVATWLISDTHKNAIHRNIKRT